MDIDALKTELLAGHPGTGAYDADDAVAATQLNAVNRTRNKPTMTGSEVMNAIVKAEFTALSAADKQMVWDIVHLGEINPFGIEADLFVDIFGGGSATITDLQTARKYDVSRGVELGLGQVKTGHVETART